MNQQILALRQQALAAKAAKEKEQSQASAVRKQKEAENWQQLVEQIKTLAPYLYDVPIELDKTYRDACIQFENCLPIYILLSRNWIDDRWAYQLRKDQIHFSVRVEGKVDYFDDLGAAIVAAEQFYKETHK